MDKYDDEIGKLFEIVKNEKLEMINEFISFLNNRMQTQSNQLPDADIGKIKHIG
jgi:hypothetical protein